MVAELTAQDVARVLEFWSHMGLAKTPERITPDIGLAWFLPLQMCRVTLDEWLWVRDFVSCDPERRFWPCVQEAIKLIRDRRRRQIEELVSIGVHRDGVLAIEYRHPDELSSRQPETGQMVALPDLSRLTEKVTGS